MHARLPSIGRCRANRWCRTVRALSDRRAFRSAVTEVVDGRLKAVGRDVERRKRDRQPETPPARASGIQVEHTADRIDLRHMGMAGDDDVNANRDGIDPQGIEVVQDKNRSVGKSHEFGIGVFAGPVAYIHVSPDCGNRRDPAKLGDDVGASDIAAVNDVIHAGQATFRFRPQQAVRVGDDAYPEDHRCAPGLARPRAYRARRISSCRMGIASTRANR
jgi:hypothetical protein